MTKVEWYCLYSFSLFMRSLVNGADAAVSTMPIIVDGAVGRLVTIRYHLSVPLVRCVIVLAGANCNTNVLYRGWQ